VRSAAMAANMQMATGQMLMQQQQQQQQQQQMQQLVYRHIMANPVNTGWQAGLPISDRLNKTMNL
jgi:hypothetical protein